MKQIAAEKLFSKMIDREYAEMADLLTGFKYIGELVTELDEKGEADRYVLGLEESYGYLTGAHA